MTIGRRSIYFYARLALSAQFVLLALVVAFVLTGASYQSTAIRALHGQAQRMQILNLTVLNEYLDAQRALRGYQATGQARFLYTFYGDQDDFGLLLHQLRDQAWPALLPSVTTQARTALASFQAADRAVTGARESATAGALYDRASAISDTFVRVTGRLQQQLARQSATLAASAGRTLGVGLPGTSAALGFGLILPVCLGALALRWTMRPLHAATEVVRHQAAGVFASRADIRGPADVRDLAASVNFLADESARLRAVEAERLRLQVAVHQASVQIRRHLRAGDVIREAVSATRDHLGASAAWVALADSGISAGGADAAGLARPVPEDSVSWLTDIYLRRRGSFCWQDLHSAEPGELPPGLREAAQRAGGVSVMVAPFGNGGELRGAITALRTDPGQPWQPPEIGAFEALAEDIGRGLEHARLYEQEERLVRELRELDQAKTSFLASSSHDLRTPLTSIRGYVEMLADADEQVSPERQAAMLEAISRNTQRLQALIEDMLTISKMELGSFTSELRPLDLTALVTQVVDAIRPTAADGGLGLELDITGESLTVEGDSDQLDRALLNLLSNAVKYTPSGGTVTVTAAGGDGSAVVTVADTGIGIPEQDQRSLGTRFFRASNAIARHIPGSGLGLTIVQTVIRNHEGKIHIASEEGHGTCVAVSIPLMEAPDTRRRAPAAQSHVAHHSPQPRDRAA